MKNIPRIFIDENLATGKTFPSNSDISHYLTRVMRTRNFLAFNNGVEFNAALSENGREIIILEKTSHAPNVIDITFCFAPIKKTDDMISMITQMGVNKIQPVITNRTNAHHINWTRIKKLIIEAAEQSGRNTIPEILPAIKFSDLDLSDIIFADERAAKGTEIITKFNQYPVRLLVGPEGGFSDDEFIALDLGAAIGMSLGRTILRAEVAAVAALAIIKNNMEN